MASPEAYIDQHDEGPPSPILGNMLAVHASHRPLSASAKLRQRRFYASFHAKVISRAERTTRLRKVEHPAGVSGSRV